MRRLAPRRSPKPHNVNAGYVCERKVRHAVGGHVVVYDRMRGFECDADHRWIVMHEPSSLHLSFVSRAAAIEFMKEAAAEYAAGVEIFPQPGTEAAARAERTARGIAALNQKRMDAGHCRHCDGPVPCPSAFGDIEIGRSR
jgi:hypothetical protein